MPATVTFVLVIVGLVMVFSASSAEAVLRGQNPLSLVLKQLAAAGVGFFVYMAASRLRPGALRHLAAPAFVLSLALLALVRLPGVGTKVNGARRWIDLGVVQLQPSELAKVALVLWIAAMFAPRRRRSSPPLVPVLCGTALMAGLVVVEPDLGTAMVVVLTSISLLFLGGVARKVIVQLLAGGALLVTIVAVTVPYMQQRLLTFIDPWADPQGAGFQTVHALMAIGSGGWWGVGPGNGLQKISYLPEAHTDMIAATIGEEFGLIGLGCVILLFAMLVFGGLRIANAARTPHERLIAGGLTCMIGVQACINLGAVLGMLPITGIPLPFISYGGTSLVVFLAASGILVNIGRRASVPVSAAERERDAAREGDDRSGRNGRARDASAGRRRGAQTAWR